MGRRVHVVRDDQESDVQRLLLTLQHAFLLYDTTTSCNGGQVSDPEKGVLGTGAHTDYGMMTILATVSTKLASICKPRTALTEKISSR